MISINFPFVLLYHMQPKKDSLSVLHIASVISLERSLTRTWVTAPTGFPSCIIGEPDTLMSSVGQKNFVFFCGFYAYFGVKGRFLHSSSAVPKLTWMNCRKYRILRLLAFSTNSDFRGMRKYFG